MCFAYILKCFNKDQTFIYYKGHTNNLERRLKEHKNQQKKFTKRFKGNTELVYFERFNTKSKARKREFELKNMNRSLIEDLLVKTTNAFKK